jgi:hypothetical protein
LKRLSAGQPEYAMHDKLGITGSDLEYVNHTLLNPLGLVAVLVLGVLMLILPRRAAVIPLIVMACFIAPVQRLVILGIDMTLLRILILFGWARLLLRGEFAGFRWKPIDTAVLAWAAAGTLVYTIQQATSAALINRLGNAYDALGLYFLFRCLVRTWDDIARTALGFAVVSVPVALLFAVESQTGRNLFATLGGVAESTLVREGRIRCQGAFPHPILAGCFWASLMPLMASLWWNERRQRVWVVVGLGCAAVIVLCCASSTPVISLAVGAMAAALYPLRRHLRAIRWSALLGLICLHMIMRAPVWHLLSRLKAVGGSTGWHRFHLIDQAIQRVGEWWLWGTATTADWGLGLRDVTNQYVLEGVRGGLLTLSLFLIMLGLAFQGLGQRLQRVEHAPAQRAMVWGLGVALFMHAMNFVAVSYFGQIIMLFYLILGVAGALTPARAAQPHPVPYSLAALPSASGGPHS